MSDKKNPFSDAVFRDPSPEEKAALLAKAKANFSASDLQRFAELDEGTPFEDLLKELEELERQYEAEKK